jgi:hypothetical protein
MTDDEEINRCVVCGVDMGSCNPRQLCCKTYCPMEIINKIEKQKKKKNVPGQPIKKIEKKKKRKKNLLSSKSGPKLTK